MYLNLARYFDFRPRDTFEVVSTQFSWLQAPCLAERFQHWFVFYEASRSVSRSWYDVPESSAIFWFPSRKHMCECNTRDFKRQAKQSAFKISLHFTDNEDLYPDVGLIYLNLALLFDSRSWITLVEVSAQNRWLQVPCMAERFQNKFASYGTSRSLSWSIEISILKLVRYTWIQRNVLISVQGTHS